jgi:hypothetical protein
MFLNSFVFYITKFSSFYNKIVFLEKVKTKITNITISTLNKIKTETIIATSKC